MTIHGHQLTWILLCCIVCRSALSGSLLGLLQLLGPLDGVRLVLASPLGHLRVSLGHAALQLSLGLLLLLVLLPQQVTVVAGRLDTMGQGVLSLKGEKRGRS